MERELAGVLGTTSIMGKKEAVVVLGKNERGNLIAVSEKTDVMELMESEFEIDEKLKISDAFKGYIDFLDIMNDIGSHKEEMIKYLRRES